MTERMVDALERRCGAGRIPLPGTVLIDEFGLSKRPTRVWTCISTGQAPVIKEHGFDYPAIRRAKIEQPSVPDSR